MQAIVVKIEPQSWEFDRFDHNLREQTCVLEWTVYFSSKGASKACNNHPLCTSVGTLGVDGPTGLRFFDFALFALMLVSKSMSNDQSPCV